MISGHVIPKIKRAKFESYWKNIDEIKLFSPNDFKKIRQEIRSAIIDVLTKGVKEDKNDGSIRRHALSANEIKSEIQELLGYDVKKANLYFHLQVLEDIEAIQIVDTIEFNKKLTAYYSRTAKAFLLTGKTEKQELNLLSDVKFIEFLKMLNPDVPKLKIQGVLDNIQKISEHDNSNIVSWLSKYQEQLKLNQIDFVDFFKLITFLKIDNPQVKNALNELSRLLKLQ